MGRAAVYFGSHLSQFFAKASTLSLVIGTSAATSRGGGRSTA
jgi:hypothetical protein